jgi:dipeptidase E
LGVLELTALPSIGEERWVPWVREADVLLVNGGDSLYLCYWMRQSGLAGLLPSLRETVWVGLSAGSMVMTPRIGEDFVGWKPPNGGDSTLGIVDFSIFPHLDHEDLPDNSMADAEKWADDMPVPCYAIDDQTAIKVIDGTVEVVSEGHWKLFAPKPSLVSSCGSQVDACMSVRLASVPSNSPLTLATPARAAVQEARGFPTLATPGPAIDSVNQ